LQTFPIYLSMKQVSIEANRIFRRRELTHNFSKVLILAACSAAISISPLAASTLSDYLTEVSPGDYVTNGDTFTDGDKTITFDSYSDTVTCFNTVTLADVTCAPGVTSPSTPAGLTVNPSSTFSVTGLDYPGFTLEGSVSAQGYSAGGDIIDVQNDLALIYTVTATAGLISDIHLGVGGVDLSGSGEIQVGETTSTGANISVNDPPPGLLTAYAPITPPVASMTVTKDILLNSGSAAGFDLASFSAIEQSFSEVPEPRAYAAVLGLFFALFFVIKRRRQQTA
jgi:hypothetical protein